MIISVSDAHAPTPSPLNIPYLHTNANQQTDKNIQFKFSSMSQKTSNLGLTNEFGVLGVSPRRRGGEQRSATQGKAFPSLFVWIASSFLSSQ
jgi:hypothetical protein